MMKLSRKRLKGLVIIFILNLLVIFGLWLLMQHRSVYGGFTRIYPPHIITVEKTLKTNFSNRYFSGFRDSLLYFGNFKNPLLVYQVDYNLTDTLTSIVKINHTDPSKRLMYPKTIVAAPHFFIADGYTPTLFKGILGKWKASTYLPEIAYFNDIIPISPNSFVMKSISSGTKENMICKQIAGNNHLIIANKLLEKQIDGLFCTDGNLSYDQETHQLAYLYTYRNEFLCLDTNLNLKYKAKTIDTNSLAKIKVRRDTKNGANHLASPPFNVNLQSCTSSGMLFIHSAQRAQNDALNDFNTNAVIDVYELKSGAYLLSFKIHNYGGKKLRSFKVHGNILWALYDQHLLKFKLLPKYLPLLP